MPAPFSSKRVRTIVIIILITTLIVATSCIMASKNKVTEMDESRLIGNSAPQIELPSPADLDTYNLENKLINRTSQRSCDLENNFINHVVAPSYNLEIPSSDSTSTPPPPYKFAQSCKMDRQAPVAGADNVLNNVFTFTCTPATFTISNRCFTIVKMTICGVVFVLVAYFVSKAFYHEINTASMYIVTDILVISRLTI